MTDFDNEIKHLNVLTISYKFKLNIIFKDFVDDLSRNISKI